MKMLGRQIRYSNIRGDAKWRFVTTRLKREYADVTLYYRGNHRFYRLGFLLADRERGRFARCTGALCVTIEDTG
jgi:hypothetical protein